MKLGRQLGYWQTGAPEDPIDLVLEAERLGSDSAWPAEAYGSDCVSPLRWIDSQTTNIKLGTEVMQLSARTPACAAMTAMTIDPVSTGRLILGIGVSGPQVVEGGYGQPHPRPLERTRKWGTLFRKMIAREEPVEFHGNHYDLPLQGGANLAKTLELLNKPLRDFVPVHIGAEGPKNVPQTLEIADGWLPIFFWPHRTQIHDAALGLDAEGREGAGALPGGPPPGSVRRGAGRDRARRPARTHSRTARRMEEEHRHDAHGRRARRGHAAPVRRGGAAAVRRAALVGVLAVATFAKAPAASAFGVSGFANATHGSTTDEVSLADVADQVVGPVQNQNIAAPEPNPGTVTSQSSHVETTITQGVLAVALGTDSESLGYGPIVSGSATGRAEYDEYVTVSSPSLANGTPVTVRVRYRVAFGAAAAHELPPAQQADYQQYARIDLNLDAQLGTSATTHRFLQTGAGASIMSGLFADPTQYGEAVTEVPVGQTVRLRFRWNNYASSDTRPSNDQPAVFPSAQTGGSTVLVFGIASDTPDVAITSSHFGIPLPGLANVTVANALAHALPVTVGALVSVPEPQASQEEAAALIALVVALYAARYGGSHASA